MFSVKKLEARDFIKISSPDGTSASMVAENIRKNGLSLLIAFSVGATESVGETHTPSIAYEYVPLAISRV